MSQNPITADEARKIIAEELGKLDPRVREQAREAALAAVIEAGTLDKVAGSPVFRNAVSEGAASYVKRGSAIAVVIAVVAAIPMIVPYCSSQQALNQARIAGQDAECEAKRAREASVAAAKTAEESSIAATTAKDKANAAANSADQALKEAIKDAPAATKAFVEAINSRGSTGVEAATKLLTEAQSLVRANDPKRGVLQIEETLIWWGGVSLNSAQFITPSEGGREYTVAFDLGDLFEEPPTIVGGPTFIPQNTTVAPVSVASISVTASNVVVSLKQSADAAARTSYAAGRVTCIAIGKAKQKPKEMITTPSPRTGTP